MANALAEQKISIAILDGLAPKAIRMPNSRVRCETAYVITPYKPITARVRASPENALTSNVRNRLGDKVSDNASVSGCTA